MAIPGIAEPVNVLDAESLLPDAEHLKIVEMSIQEIVYAARAKRNFQKWPRDFEKCQDALNLWLGVLERVREHRKAVMAHEVKHFRDIARITEG